MKVCYLILAALSSIGFTASIICHLLAWFHVEPPWGKSVFVLHVGFLILWIPLVTASNRTMPKEGRGNFEHLLAVLPRAVRFILPGLGGYTAINFVYFILSTFKYPRGKVPFYLELRGFSGHWMLFYGMAAIGFVALARLARKRPLNFEPRSTGHSHG
jgi:hypothetical protein